MSRTPHQMLRIAALLMVSAMLVACVSPPVRSSITVFHTLPASGNASTFAFVALPAEEGDLEYAAYRDQIRDALIAHGWQEAPPDRAARFVTFAYGIDQGRVATVNMPVWGQTGIASATTTGSYGYGTYSGTTTYTPEYGVTGFVPVSVTQYSRVLRVEIVNRAASANEKPQRVYQADVLSVGRTGTLARVMPAMIEGLFEVFPGKTGQTRIESGAVR